MNVLSLFDGISCAKIALDNLGVEINNYYASEIDPYAIKVSNINHPDIINLGDIRKIQPGILPEIDLLIGGSPCQDLSNAQKGLGLNGKKSGLFYDYIRLLKAINPRYFLLENVKNKWGNLMSEYVGIDYVEISSAKFSAQSRPRYYWTNIDYANIPPENHNTQLNDIIEGQVDEKYYLRNPRVDEFLKNNSVANKKPTKEGIVKALQLPREIHNDHDRQRRVYALSSKSPTLLARADTTKILHQGRVRKLTPIECERLQGIPDNYTQICSDTQRYKIIGNAFTVQVIEHLLSGLNKRPFQKKIKKSISMFEGCK